MKKEECLSVIQFGYFLTNKSSQRVKILTYTFPAHRRVHAILYTQFLIIFKMVAVFVWVPSFSDHAHNNLWMFWVCLGLMYALMNALISCDNLRTKYIVAIVLAICEAYMLGILSTLHQEKELVIATAATAMLTLVFTASAFRVRSWWWREGRRESRRGKEGRKGGM